MSVRLYVGNLPKEVNRDELQSFFAEGAQESDTVSAKVIVDRKTGKCRGFGFVTVKTDEQADQFIEKFNGQSFKESPLKIEKALPRSKSKKEEGESGGSSAPSAPSGGGKSSSRRGKKGGGSSSSSSSSGSNQPDPRWADELSKLKEMLAAQAK